MKRFLKYIGNLLICLLPVIIIICCFGIFNSKGNLFKYRPAIILSGSMEPILSIDDLVFTKKTDEIKIGDIVTFYDENGKRVMHRVIEINNDNIITKGDTNNIPDKPIKMDQVEGIYVGKIKYIGKIFRFIKSPIGLLSGVILIVAVIIFPNINKRKRASSNDEDNKTKKDKRIKMILAGFIYMVILSGCIIAGYYSKYQRGFIGNDKTSVATWNNNIELLSSDTLHFQNTKKDTNIINFNLIYGSDVSVYYSISLDNVSKKLGIELSNDENSLGIKQSNNSFIVDFNSNVGTFDITNLHTNHSIILNNIEATYEIDGTKNIYIFKDNTINKMIKISVNGDNFNLQFINFGKFEINDPNTKQFTLKVSAVEEELPNLNNLELYATFEQID